MNNPSTSYRGGRFFQYRPDVLGRDLETLLQRKLYCGAMKDQNDPFEAAALKALSDNSAQQKKYLEAGVACFCRSLTNPLLWAHYANKHAGFVVGYGRDNPLFYGEQHKGSILFDVKYEDALPTLDHFPNIDEFRLEAMRTKPTCWAYEQEQRIFYTPGNQTMEIPEGSIKEIIFGARMTQERKSLIIATVKEAKLDVRFGEMQYLIQGYGVNLNWISD